MFNTKDIANLKEVVHNQGSWHNHTHIAIENSGKMTKDESAIKHFTKLLTDAISSHKPGQFFFAKKEESFSTFQLVENSCIAGDFSFENPKSSLEIFSSNQLNLEEVLRITREFFSGSALEVTSFQKVGN